MKQHTGKFLWVKLTSQLQRWLEIVDGCLPRKQFHPQVLAFNDRNIFFSPNKPTCFILKIKESHVPNGVLCSALAAMKLKAKFSVQLIELFLA